MFGAGDGRRMLDEVRHRVPSPSSEPKGRSRGPGPRRRGRRTPRGTAERAGGSHDLGDRRAAVVLRSSGGAAVERLGEPEVPSRRRRSPADAAGRTSVSTSTLDEPAAAVEQAARARGRADAMADAVSDGCDDVLGAVGRRRSRTNRSVPRPRRPASIGSVAQHSRPGRSAGPGGKQERSGR